jgi:thiol-disulfide isomerase/thioredoxin
MTRRNRQTGTLVELVDNRDGSFEADSEYGWATVCLDHGDYCLHDTRKLAESWMAEPAQWCSYCDEIAARLEQLVELERERASGRELVR